MRDKLIGFVVAMEKEAQHLLKEAQIIIDNIKEEFIKLSEKHLSSKYINWNEYKKDARNTISRFVYQTTRRNPITIPVIISTESNK